MAGRAHRRRWPTSTRSRCRTSRSPLLPSRGRAAARPRPRAGPGEVVVVGTGPAGPLWLTPEARRALAAADELVGYTTYLDRVPVSPGQPRHGSDNKVEAERAEFALDLARRGRRVAVVSGGDPGVFAMATAVLEVGGAGRVQGRPGAGAAGGDRRQRGRRPRRAPRSATTTPRSRSPTGSSRGRSSRSGCAPPRRPTWCSRSTTRARAAGPGRSAQARDLLLEHRAAGHPGGRRAATSAAPEERVTVIVRSPISTRPRSTCARC